ncbi:hypothetical protein O181_063381 [Austropuccinia psidii MF-1]|uniref:Uncharacterized protein n=1 Tax=Austropuccinia psidii MF-1 TaxID=1389203 RepID=A0A9Q3EJX9_9BASI|nr:hypothetical protein [Austropuccinia psidii MF-1]
MASPVHCLYTAVHGPWDQLGPFWPNSNEEKRCKGGRPAAPNSRWAHLSLILAIIPEDQNGQKPQEPKTLKLAINDHVPQYSTHGLWQTPEATSLVQESFSLSYGPHTAGTRNGAYMVLYTNMDHFSSEI